MLFVLLNYYQVTDLIGSCNVVTPPEAAWSFDSVAFTNNILTFFKPDCAGFAGFQESMIFKCAGPFLIAAVAAFTKGCSFVASKVAKKEFLNMDNDRLFNVFMSLMFTFFSAISSVSLLLFKCRDNPNEKTTLSSDLSITCMTSEKWQSMLVIAIFAVLLYCVGFGAIFTRAIYWATIGDTFSDRGFQMRWKFLFIKFRPDVWWWALLFLMKNFLTNFGFALMASGIEQLYWIITVIVLYTFMVVTYMPYREPIVNAVEIFASFGLIYIASLMSWFAAKDNADWDHAIGISITCIIYVPAVPAALTTLYLFMKEKKNDIFIEQPFNQAVSAMKYMSDLTLRDPELSLDFYKRLCSWDRLHMHYFAQAFEGEMLGKSTEHKRTVDKTRVQKERVSKVQETSIDVGVQKERVSKVKEANDGAASSDDPNATHATTV